MDLLRRIAVVLTGACCTLGLATGAGQARSFIDSQPFVKGYIAVAAPAASLIENHIDSGVDGLDTTVPTPGGTV